MVPHKATIATALPVHYYVAKNTTPLTNQQVEEFTYHLCYNYFNFMGSIKVPGSVIYAHKIANYAHAVTKIMCVMLFNKTLLTDAAKYMKMR